MSAKKIGFALVLVFALILSACATPTPAPQPEAPAVEQPAVEQPAVEEPVTEQPAVEEPVAQPEPPGAPKVATFIFTQEFDTLNYLYTNMWFSSITNEIWNAAAWVFDDQNNPVPMLVAQMPDLDNGGISQDGKVITLTLKQGLLWSDGAPLTSDDFLFTYEMYVHPNNSVASSYPYDLIQRVEAPDPLTFVMYFDEPLASWMGTLWGSVLPAHELRPVFERDGSLNTAQWNYAPTVSAGPFVFDSWESGSFARFVANPNFFMGRPKLDEIFIRFVPDDASQVAALVTGAGDLGTFFAYSDVPVLENADINVVSVFSGYNEGWFFNLHPEKGHPALKDKRVRQAIAMAFDRFSLNQDLLLGLTEPASTRWDNMPYNDPTLEPWPFDPDRARQLLDEAGWVDTNGDGVRDKDGDELVLRYGTTYREIRRDTQAVAQQQLAEVGIKVELFNYDSDVYFSGYEENGPAATGALDIFQYSATINMPDPDTGDFLCSEIPSDESPTGLNWNHHCDEELDRLFRLQATQVDYDQRVETFQKISRHLFEEVYWLGIWRDPDMFGISSRLQNVKLSGAHPFFNIYEWDMQQ
jgi:peptide/nickel transport system substrate-binding protein